MIENFYKNKKVLITGHTGFKGSWLSLWLINMGAEVSGYSLEPPTKPNLFESLEIKEKIKHKIGNVLNLPKFEKFLNETQPEIVFHLAAQSLVRLSYQEPKLTYETNITGTINLFEAIRKTKSVKSVIIVTSDKCYENKEWVYGYRENEPMGGFDPYSSSKGCVELVTNAYRNSFFNPKDYNNHGVAIASVRAGNVIGGGDWAEDRLIPDFIRAISTGKEVKIRSPLAVRPWQHVLEPLSGYLTLAEKLYNDGIKYAEGWNFGPDDKDVKDVEWIIKTICKFWGENASYCIDKNPQLHEANYLKLDCSKAKYELGWLPKWGIEKTLKFIVEWNKAYLRSENMRIVSEKQINEYRKLNY